MKKIILVALTTLTFVSCKKNSNTNPTIVGKDITKADKVSIDRFSAAAGHLMVRTASNGLPEANAAVSFDDAPFITQGLSKSGESTEYYNFDIQSTTPAPIYVFFKNGGTTQVAGQNNVINTLPGEMGYNDFWVVNKVTVPDNYVPNSLTSEAEIISSGYNIQKTTTIVNCPVVPFGSTASKKFDGGSQALTMGWYKGKACAYFNFDESGIVATESGKVPLSTIYVMFNDNMAGPSSGFKTETGVGVVQTHNVVETSPGDASYSPLWDVVVLNNSAFASVTNLTTAQAAMVLNESAGFVNCPIVN